MSFNEFVEIKPRSRLTKSAIVRYYFVSLSRILDGVDELRSSFAPQTA